LTVITNRLFLSYYFYFMLGIYVAARFDNIKTLIQKVNLFKLIGSIVAGGVIITYFDLVGLNIIRGLKDLCYILSCIINPVFYLMLFILFTKIAILLTKRGEKWIYEIGRHSFGIYLVHAFVLNVCNILLGKINISFKNIIFYPVAFITTLIISFLVANLLSRLSFGKYIIGMSTRNQIKA
jgi:surface polysaccharide O-acyltransferase-like enzyme